MENCDQNSGWCFQSASKKFLAGNFSSWGIPMSMLSSANAGNVTVDKVSALSSIRTSISRVRLPTARSALKSANSFLSIDDEDEEDDGDDISKVGPNGFGRSLFTPAESQQVVERGIGGYTTFAARQAQQDRVAATNVTVGSRGFSDGFYTSRILAASTDFLSRLGFGTQYQIDTFQAYVDAGRFKASDQAAYNAQFAAGVKAAEGAITNIVSSFSKKA